MKKTRKLLCVFMSVVLLFGCFASQSYALFDFLKKDPEPVTVKSFEITDNIPISLRDVENQFEEDTWYINDRSEENLEKEAEKLYYFIGDGSISMGYKLSLSDGQVKEGYFPATTLFIDENAGTSSSGKVRTNVNACVRYKDLFEAAENGKSTVTVEYSVYVYVTDGSKNEYGEYKWSNTDSYIIEKERDIIPSYVRKFEVVSGVPQTAVEGYMCYDFREAVFNYELYDGTKGTEKVTTKGESTFSYYLAGNYLHIDFIPRNEEFKITMMDTTITHKAKEVDSDFSMVVLTDAVLDEGEDLVSVRCIIYKKDGTKHDFTVQMNEPYLDFIDGIRVHIYSGKSKSHKYENAEKISVRANVATVQNAQLDIELSEGCPCVCHKDGISQFLFKIANVFWKLFGINRECLECSATHY